MTVLTTNTEKFYEGNGTGTIFPVDFVYHAPEDVKVQRIDEKGEVEDLKSGFFFDTVDQVIHYPGYPPGQAPPADEWPPILPSGEKLRIYRETPVVQNADFPGQTMLAIIERLFDKFTMLIQESYRSLSQYGDKVLAALRIAGEAKEESKEALQASSEANKMAGEAKGAAEAAVKTAGEAKEAAGEAVKIAGEAKNTAEGISGAVDEANQTAGEAKKAAEAAVKTAGEAKETAEGIDKKATNALENSDDAVERVEALEKEIAGIQLGDATTLNGSSKDQILETALNAAAAVIDKNSKINKPSEGDVGKIPVYIGNGSFAWEPLRKWQSLKNVVVGQVVYPADPISTLAFECVKAGTTGTVEPTGLEMQAVTDGSVVWGIFDVRYGRPKVNGDFIFVNTTSADTGYKIANGASLSNLSTTYPVLYEALQNKKLAYMDMTTWNTTHNSRGGLGFMGLFGYDGGDACILPDMRDMTIKASGTLGPRYVHHDAIQNIKAGWSDTDSYYGTKHSTGAMSITAGVSSTWTMMSQNMRNSTVYDLDASRTVRTATETRVKSVMQLSVVFIGYEVI